MRNFTLFLLLTFVTVTVFAEDKSKDKPKADKSFVTHSAEVQVTPATDYFIFREGTMVNNTPYESQYPFIGFGFGAQYIYRPVEVFGISTGLAVKMQGAFSRTRSFSPVYITSRTNSHKTMPMKVPSTCRNAES